MTGTNSGRLGRLVHDLARSQLQERFVHLSLGEPVVKWCDRDVAAVGNLGPRLVGVDSGACVVASCGHLAGAGGADGAGTEPGSWGVVSTSLEVRLVCRWVGVVLTWSVADGCIEGCSDHGDVVVLIGLDQTLNGLQVGEAGNAGEGPLDSCLLEHILYVWIQLQSLHM